MFNIIGKCIWATFIFSAMTTASAQELYRPINFNSVLDLFSSEIVFPDTNENVDLIVRCGTYVTRRGRLRRLYCMDHTPETAPYFQAIEDSYKQKRINAAQVNAKNVDVTWMMFSIRFIKTDESEDIVLYPHHFRNPQFDPSQFIVAQPYLDHTGFHCQLLEYYYVIEFTVNEKGIAELPDNSLDQSNFCIDTMRTNITSRKYIPAHYQGVPVSSTVHEHFFNLRSCISDRNYTACFTAK